MNLTRPFPELLPALVACSLALASGAGATQQERTARAWELYEDGDIEGAGEEAKAALVEDAGDSRARHLRIVTSYLEGAYEDSLAQVLLLDRGYSEYGSLDELVREAYLHLGRVKEAAAHAEATGASGAIVRHLQQVAERPMTVELESTTVLGFLDDAWLAGMMPAIPIVLNGIAMPGHLDTGGNFLHMSPQKAADLGIETEAYGQGVANNQKTDVWAGVASSLVLGDASLENVPVFAIDALSGQAEDLVILGTRILSNFLTTWDNDSGRLILTPRGAAAAARVHYEQYGAGGEELPFYLAGDHYMWAHGSVGDNPVLYFVDTGLVTIDEKGRQPGLMMPRDVLDRWSIDPGSSTFLDVPGSVRLGSGGVAQEGISLMVSDRRNLASWHGLQPDALLSHGFLKDFVWTIDFDLRVYRLRPSEVAAVAADVDSGAALDLAIYVGSYEIAPGVALEVTTSGGSLLLQAPGQQKIPMTPTGEPDTFEIELAGATIRFVRGDDGALSELVLIQRGVEQRAKKTDG